MENNQYGNLDPQDIDFTARAIDVPDVMQANLLVPEMPRERDQEAFEACIARDVLGQENEETYFTQIVQYPMNYVIYHGELLENLNNNSQYRHDICCVRGGSSGNLARIYSWRSLLNNPAPATIAYNGMDCHIWE